MTAERNPWSKFYWADWRADPGLRMCGLAARGLWMELLGLMHEADPVGHLLVSGRPPSDAQIAAMVGTTPAEVRKLRAELLAAGVPSVTEGGIWVSRRMVRDAQRSAVNRQNAARGGNPKLLASRPDIRSATISDNRPDNRPDIRPTERPDITDRETADKPPDISRATRVPEARSQKPESPLPPLPSARSPVDALAGELVRTFDRMLVEVFGDLARRPWPHQSDLVVARRWAERLSDYEWFRSLFEERMTAMERSGADPPKMLKYFDNLVAERLAEANRPGINLPATSVARSTVPP